MTCVDWSATRSTRGSSPTSVRRSRGWCATRAPGKWRSVTTCGTVRRALAAAFADGVTSQGLDVVRIGLASTDQLYFASGLLDCPGAMFTASHNPAAYNGIKLCRAGAKPVGKDTGLSTVSDDVIAGVPTYDGPRGTIARPRRARRLRRIPALAGRFDGPAAAAGRRRRRATGWPATPRPRSSARSPSLDVLPLYFELDGTFPNHEANPLDADNLVDLQKHVVATGADIGLAFDGDADRCFVVDESGHPVSPSAVTALVAARELSREIGATVIHNLITSRAVPELVVERGGTPVRSRVGHSYIKALDGRHRRDLRRRALGALLLPRLLGRGLRNAGRPSRAGRARRAAPAVVGVDGRLPALRSLRRDQLHRRRLADVRGCGAEVVRQTASTRSTTSTA